MAKVLRRHLAIAALVIFGGDVMAENAQCLALQKPLTSTQYSIRVDTSNAVRKLTPEFFGFNLEWVEFQLSLWDSSTRKVNSDAVSWLKAFPGAVYRYPGGTVANYFDWREAIGNARSRKPQRAVTWRDPLAVDFGPREYLDFVSAVGGRPWYVLNLYGKLDGEVPPVSLAKEAGDIAAFFRQENAAGKPAIYRWELGNELDRDKYLWHPEKYADIARLVMASVLASDKNARFVAMSQDWNASKDKHGIDAATYNTLLGKKLKGPVTEFASHHYYDGRPWGPPVSNQIRQHCRNREAIEQAGIPSPIIWVTEHARTPKGTPADKDWKKNWPQSADLSAAISVADMISTLAGDAAVNGQFLHALHATDGPWPLFHRNKDGGVVPSAVYWGLRVLRESMQEEVLATTVNSANRSGFEGGYDLRAVAMANSNRSNVSIWLINRAGTSIPASLQLPSMANVMATAAVTILANPDPLTSNYGGITKIRPRIESRELAFDRDGRAILDVPASAVMSVSIPASGNKK